MSAHAGEKDVHGPWNKDEQRYEDGCKSGDAHTAEKALGRSVTFDGRCGWPTPNNCRRVADALDQITPGHYGAILRAYADAEDARFAEFGPIGSRVIPPGEVRGS